MSAATELLKPLMVGEGTEPVGRVCLGTVKGDMHDIGKNLVRIMMEGSGIEVFDLGVDTSAEQFVSTAVENHCGVIACSSLLTTTMEEMREVVKLVRERGLLRRRRRCRCPRGGEDPENAEGVINNYNTSKRSRPKTGPFFYAFCCTVRVLTCPRTRPASRRSSGRSHSRTGPFRGSWCRARTCSRSRGGTERRGRRSCPDARPLQ